MDLFPPEYLDEYTPEWQDILLEMVDNGYFDDLLDRDDPEGLIPDETVIRIVQGETRKRHRRYDPYHGLTFGHYLSFPLGRRFRDVAKAIKATQAAKGGDQ